MLGIRKIDPCISQNGALHFTSQFGGSELIVRRGQSFLLCITFDRALKPEDSVNFIFTVEDETRPSTDEGTRAIIPLSWKGPLWKAVRNQTKDSTTIVEITTPTDAIVARWNLTVRTNSTVYGCDTKIYILFNPWCLFDEVHLPSNVSKYDAVLECWGVFRAGPSMNRDYENWNYDQFEKHVLQHSLHLIYGVGKLKYENGGDCFKIVEAARTAVRYIVEWEGFTGSWTKEPTLWNGSKETMKTFFDGMEPVKCRQYWVYATLLTTICRAVGIPAHTVSSNYPFKTSLPHYVWNRVWMGGRWIDVEAIPGDLRVQLRPDGMLPIWKCAEARNYPGDLQYVAECGEKCTSHHSTCTQYFGHC